MNPKLRNYLQFRITTMNNLMQLAEDVIDHGRYAQGAFVDDLARIIYYAALHIAEELLPYQKQICDLYHLSYQQHYNECHYVKSTIDSLILMKNNDGAPIFEDSLDSTEETDIISD